MTLRIAVPDNEPPEYYLGETSKLLERYSGPLDTVVDLGAHVGCFSILAATAFGAKLTFAVEADPVNFTYLVNNIEANGLTDRIFPIMAAMADKSFQKVDLFLAGTSGQRSTTWDPSRFPYVRVLTLSLPDLMNLIPTNKEDGKVRPIDFLKVDIEGSEFKTLKNGLERVKYLDVEMHPETDPKYHVGQVHSQVVNLTRHLENLGFKRENKVGIKRAFYGYKDDTRTNSS